MTLVGAVFVVRLIALVSRFLLAPKVPSLRLVHLDDDGARASCIGGSSGWPRSAPAGS